MALTKAAVIIYARELINAKGEAVADGFWKTFSLEERKYFQTLLPANKLPIEKVTKFIELALPVIFPDKSPAQGLWQLGYQNAQNDMKGIYRVLLKIATLETVIKQAAVIWKTYHDQGQASVRRLSSKEFMFIVENYPDIPKSFRDLLNGYITGLVNLTGIKNVEVVRNDADPNAWNWHITIE